jgi:peptidoglycan/xylan/chitin deacetylase (PgdA/CDA1 family)
VYVTKLTLKEIALIDTTSNFVIRVAAMTFAKATRVCLRRPWLLDRIFDGGHNVIYCFSKTEPHVALTIDDSPFASSTPAILDVLERVGAKATFFIIGSNVQGNEALLERMVHMGHEIGNHTLRDFPSHRLSPGCFRDEFLQTDAILRKFTSHLHWFRPASGRFTPSMLEVIAEFGYEAALGDVYPFDPHIPFEQFASEVIIRATLPGSIIILHDGLNRGRRTAAVLNRAIPSLKGAGYRLVTLSNLA